MTHRRKTLLVVLAAAILLAAGGLACRRQATTVDRQVNALPDDPGAVEPLIMALRDEDRHVRLVAAAALWQLGDGAIGPLIAALKDEETGVRHSAAVALGMLGDPRGIEPLIAALKDEHRGVRFYAAEALGELGDVRAVEPLIAALKDENWVVRRYAAYALGELGDRRAVKPLEELLDDENEYVREPTKEALKKLRGNASGIQVEVTPLRKSYHLGEPVAVSISLRNTGSSEVAVFSFDPPGQIGIRFKCDDKDAIPTTRGSHDPRNELFGTVSLSIRGRRLKPGKELRYIFALRRFLEFTKAKRYRVTFLAKYRVSYYKAEGKAAKTHSGSAHVATRGEFTINIQAGPMDKKVLAEYITSLGGKGTIGSLEALELLSWSDDPVVIDPLLAKAKGNLLCEGRVVRALGRFLGKEDKAKAAILELAQAGTRRTLEQALLLFKDQGIKVPSQLWPPILLSRNVGKKYVVLGYLLEHGTPEDVVFVKPLVNDKNEHIASFAAEAVKQMQSRKATTRPSKNEDANSEKPTNTN